ncbi:cysteine desulfurase [Candidatus Woesearchaeota archaeon]|nr:cysteine desulfurase [Candidatus Woesearchaeota archaeon]
MSKIFLDNAATTRVDELVVEAMNKIYLNVYGNPSSVHIFGEDSRDVLVKSREIIAKAVGVDSNEIIFTSGGTESNNLALKGIMHANNSKGKHMITQKTEHPSILKVCSELENEGYEVTYLPVDKDGLINLEELKKAIRKDTVLVTIMHANNEIGTIFPIEDIAKICKEKKLIFHTDACQSFLKVKFNPENIDLITINSHKIHGPKGVGALIIKSGIKLQKQMHGGEQESNIRSGTENLPGICGFAKACSITKQSDVKRMTELRNYLIDLLLKIPNTKLNGSNEKRLCNNINISFKDVEGDMLLFRLSNQGLALSTGSACTARNNKPSHVLQAIGLNKNFIDGSLRISLSKYTTKEELDTAYDLIQKSVKLIRSLK